MRDTLPQYPYSMECDIVNLNTSNQFGIHWVCYYRNKNDIIYFDSYGQITPSEIQRYLMTGSECDRSKEVIQRNRYIVQASNTSVCGHLCLFVTDITNERWTFSNDFKSYAALWWIYNKVIGKIQFKPKKALFYHNITLLDLITRYIYNWIHKIIHYCERNHTMQLWLFQCAICYRDNDTPSGKRECDR